MSETQGSPDGAGPDREARSPPTQPDMFRALADRDILFALLCHCLPWAEAAATTTALLKRFTTFTGVITATEGELSSLECVTGGTIGLLKCVHGSAVLLTKSTVRDRPMLRNWVALTEYLQAAMATCRDEQARVLFLNSKNQLIADEICGEGDVSNVMIYPRKIVRRALELNATALILVHNHPSGDPTPSQPDILMTREIKSAANLFGITLHDHVIVAEGSFASLRRLGLT